MVKRSIVVKLCFVALMIILTGCGGSGGGSTSSGGGTGAISAQLQWLTFGNSSVQKFSGMHALTAPVGVVTVRIVVSASDMSTIQQDFPAEAGTGTINGVPAGSNRILTAQGLDASGVVTNQGVITGITVQPGVVTNAGTVVMNPAGQTFTVSGTVTLNGNGLAGVTVSLQGTSFTAVTASDGTYAIPSVPNATYTIVPSVKGYTFTPATSTVPDSNGNVSGQNFVATPIPVQTYSISGTVTLNGNGLAGVTMSLQGTSFTAVTASDGTYTISGVQNGTYTLVPSLSGYVFTPQNIALTVNNANVPGQNSTAIAQTYAISGVVTLNSTGLVGVTVTLLGTSFSTVTANDGTYSFAGVPNGAYTIIPTLKGYTFTPVNISVIVNNANMPGQNFTAVSPGGSIQIGW